MQDRGGTTAGGGDDGTGAGPGGGSGDRAYDALTVAAQARVGQVLVGKWRLDRLLGVGGMAAVYAATHRNGNRVAVKVLHAHCVANDDIRSRFAREGYVANMIDHPGAVRVLDDDNTEDGAVFLVMQLLEGETLEGRLSRRGRLPEDEALGIVYHLLDVLASAHAKGIIHRDIKLDNVFITAGGEVKVLDFGIARLHESTHSQVVNRTRTNAMMGTPAFMAPEQALGRFHEVDAQTDLWAVGATLFKLLTGRNVHEAATLNEQLVSAATKPAPPLRRLLPAATPHLAMVVDRALAFAKLDRWPDARAMQDAMRPSLGNQAQGMPYVRPTSVVAAQDQRPSPGSWRDGSPIPSPRPASVSASASASSSSPSSRPRWPRAFLLIGGAAAVLLGLWLMYGRTRSELAAPEPAPASLPVQAERPPVPPPTVAPSPPPTETAAAGESPPPATRTRPAAANTTRRATGEKRKARPAPGSDDDDIWNRRH